MNVAYTYFHFVPYVHSVYGYHIYVATLVFNEIPIKISVSVVPIEARKHGN